MYVRMYELLVLNILMLIYWHIRKSEIKQLTYKDLIPLYFMVIVGFLTHYYYCVIVTILFLVYLIKYIKQKQLNNVILYIITLIASALTGIIIFPYSIQHIFFSYRGEGIKTSFFEFETLLSKILENIRLINSEIFNNYTYIIVILAILVCVLWLITKKKTDKKERNDKIKYITIPMAIYLGVSIICSPYIDLRYLMPVIPLIFCSLIYVFYDILQDITNSKNTFFILLAISVCFAITVIPKLSNNLYTYKGQGKILEYLENEINSKPMVYIYEDYSAEYNKTMECYEALTKVDRTYIMSKDKFSINNFKNVIKDVNTENGIVIMMHYAYEEEILGEILNQKMYQDVEIVGMLGRFVIIELK